MQGEGVCFCWYEQRLLCQGVREVVVYPAQILTQTVSDVLDQRPPRFCPCCRPRNHRAASIEVTFNPRCTHRLKGGRATYHPADASVYEDTTGCREPTRPGSIRRLLETRCVRVERESGGGGPVGGSGQRHGRSLQSLAAVCGGGVRGGYTADGGGVDGRDVRDPGRCP